MLGRSSSKCGPAVRQLQPAALPQLVQCRRAAPLQARGRHAPHTPGPAVTALQLVPTQQQHLCSRSRHVAHVWPFDQAWGTQIDGQSLASQLFAASLFPYLAFLFYLHRSGKAPKLTLFGFYFLLAFVGATIPAGIYAKTHYGTSLANVDWLHGSAESLLTITNLLVVLGLRQGIKEAEAKNAAAAAAAAEGTTAAAPAQVQSGSPSSNGVSAPAAAAAAAAAEQAVPAESQTGRE